MRSTTSWIPTAETWTCGADSDGGDRDGGVTTRKPSEVGRLVGHDDATAEPDGCRDDESVDGLLASRSCCSEEMTGDACDAGSGRDHLREPATQDDVDGFVVAAASVELDENSRWHANGSVPSMSAAHRSANALVTRAIGVRTSEGGKCFAVED